MDATKEPHYIRMAIDHPDILCSEVPLEILDAAAAEGEPTKFMEEYFATGHSHWLAKKHGRRINVPKIHMNRAILVLWFRACLLNTDHLLGNKIRDADLPFFSDEGLYWSP